MASRMEKNHGKKRELEEKTLFKDPETLTPEDRQLLDEMYQAHLKEQEQREREQYKINRLNDMNRFLNWGIVIVSILLCIVLYVAFTK
ncbi:hypothetical protein KG091_06560 [Carnobacteriaceae bacterium zg-ZUI78]|nr:hypothetical protein [Carnobacteriaceae bacterium zg-ZUI78]